MDKCVGIEMSVRMIQPNMSAAVHEGTVFLFLNVGLCHGFIALQYSEGLNLRSDKEVNHT
jgi:hypothetical protein